VCVCVCIVAVIVFSSGCQRASVGPITSTCSVTTLLTVVWMTPGLLMSCHGHGLLVDICSPTTTTMTWLTTDTFHCITTTKPWLVQSIL